MENTPSWWDRNLFWGPATVWLALTLAALGHGMTGHPLAARWLLYLSWPFGVFAFWCAIAHWRAIAQRQSKVARVWITVIVAITLAAVYAIISVRFCPIPPDIYPLYRVTYEKFRRDLGEPTSEAVKATGCYVANCDKGVVFWIRDDSIFYGVPNDPSRNVTEDRDAMWDQEELWGDSKVIREKFAKAGHPIPEDAGHLAPFLGFASHYYKDFERWSWIGWPTWDCMPEQHRVYYQEFEHGKIFGPLPARPDSEDSRLQLVFDNGRSAFELIGYLNPAWTCVKHQ